MIDKSKMTLVEKARLFWNKKKECSPFSDTFNPVSLQKGKDLIFDHGKQSGKIEICSLYSTPHVFHEWQFTSLALVRDLTTELSTRSGYPDVKLFVDGK